jgi:hypothetical protein
LIVTPGLPITRPPTSSASWPNVVDRLLIVLASLLNRAVAVQWVGNITGF